MATRNPLTMAHEYWQQARWDDQSADAFALATVDGRGLPAVRTLLFKSIDSRGFGFVTQARGPKVRHFAKTPTVELCANWPSIQLQLRARGRIQAMPEAQVDALWASRDREAQILYHLRVPQSKVLPSFATIKSAVKAGATRWADTETIPRASWYVGFLVEPQWIEFLHHSPSRCNERIRFTKSKRTWKQHILAP
jgi:pyridoxamine 5'-phosphate oxidase